jgi:hypothetical protein
VRDGSVGVIGTCGYPEEIILRELAAEEYAAIPPYNEYRRNHHNLESVPLWTHRREATITRHNL